MISIKKVMVGAWFGLLVCILLPAQPGFAQVQTEWVARYSGELTRDNHPNALAVDNAGNVYVAGNVYSSAPTTKFYSYYTTVKYDSNGSLVWEKQFCGGIATGYANAISVDAAGNVYVTGVCGPPILNRATTVKYDPNGNVLWSVNGFNGEATALSVDAAGNVYVTGYSYGSDSAIDYATAKYDANGNELWMAYYNGPRNGDDYPAAIAVDHAGDVYVTGRSNGVALDYATIKYDPDGSQLWVARYSGSGMNAPMSDNTASAITLDTIGNVYVTGTGDYVFSSRWGFSNYTTLKYDTNGNKQWIAQYTGPDNESHAVAIAVDSTGNVYVTGYSFVSLINTDYVTVKYDANGNQVWVASYNGPGNDFDYASAMALDTDGNAYVTGRSNGSGIGTDFATVKYDPDGNQIWVSRYNGPGNVDDSATAIALDALGNVYVTGESEFQFATIKLSQAGYNSNGGNSGGNSNGGSGCFITTVVN